MKLLSSFVGAGLDPDSFWRITPKEMQARLDGASLRLEREHNDRAWLAYASAALARAKKLPKLEKLLIKKKVAKNWQDQLMIAQLWNSRINAIERANGAKGLPNG